MSILYDLLRGWLSPPGSFLKRVRLLSSVHVMEISSYRVNEFGTLMMSLDLDVKATNLIKMTLRVNLCQHDVT